MKKKIPISKRVNHSKFRLLIGTYWIHLLFIFFLVNFIATRALQLTFFAQSCMTQAMIDADSRCLYVYANNIYQKGSRSNPHHGHPCGMDVTSILPGSHQANLVRYLDPNLVAPLCSNVEPTSIPPTSIPTPIPPTSTPRPNPTDTPRPNPTATLTIQQPTNTPTSQIIPSVTSQPTRGSTSAQASTPIPTSTPKPNTTNNSTKIELSPTKSTQITLSTTNEVRPTTTLAPIISTSQTQTGFGKYISDASIIDSKSSGTNSLSDMQVVPQTPAKVQFWTSIIFWSELLTGGSFILLLGTVVVAIARMVTKPKKK